MLLGGYNVEQNRYLRMADPQANNPIWSFNLSIDDFNGYKDLVEITGNNSKKNKRF
jgi:hypothetical protein